MNERLSFDEVEQRAQETAIKAAVSASALLLRYWPNPSNAKCDLELQIVETKSGTGNYSTNADIESEQFIIDNIKSDNLLNGHGIIAEESDEIITQSDYLWIIDPIDGTAPFKNGLPEFGINLALLKNGEPIMGVIAMPALEQLIVARKNRGANLLSFDGKQIADLSLRPDRKLPSINKTLVAYDLGYENRAEQLRKYTEKIADKVGYTPCYASASTANFRLAQGLIHGFFAPTPTKMDIAAAAAIIPETGGVVSDINGQPIYWAAQTRTYLAAKSPQIHTQLVEMLAF